MLEIYYTVNKVFSPFCAPSVHVSNTSWNHFDCKSSC